MKQYHHRLLFILCLLLVGKTARIYAQNISYETTAQPFPFTHALYTNEMRRVYQDSEGYVWFATTSGLARWDGYRLLTLRNDYQHSDLLTSNDLNDMADASGWLWIGSSRGINCYNQRNGHFCTPADTRLRTLSVNDVKADGKGGVWVAANQRLFHWDGNDSLRTEEMNPFDGICNPCDINTLSVDSHGRLWVACFANVLLRIEENKGEWTAKRMPLIPVDCKFTFFYEDSQGLFWAGTWGHGLWQLLHDGNNSTECWQRHDLNISAARQEDDFVFSMAEAHGLLWLLTYERLHALRYEGGRLTDVSIDNVMPTNKMFTQIIRDREGNLWLPSYDDGCTIRFNTPDLQGYRLPTLAHLLQHDANLKGLLADGQRYVWLNQDRYGILLLDTETGEIAGGTPQKWEEMSLLVSSHRPHSAWTGRRDGTVATLLTHDGMAVSTVEQVDVSTATDDAAALIALHEETNGDLWLLTWNHLFLRRKDKSTILVAKNSEPFTAMTPCSDGKGVLCADSRHIVRCTEQNGSIVCTSVSTDFNPIGDETVHLLTTYGDGSVWMVTSLGRIIRSDHSMKQFQTMPLTEQLAGEEAQDMRCSGNTLWLMTDKRLVAYDVRNATIQTYPTGQDDICVQRFLLHALDVDSAGTVLAGGYGGFIRIQPSMFNGQSSMFNVPVVTDVLTNSRSVFFGADKNDDNTFQRITLPCDAQNIEIQLSTLCYGSSRPMQMQYRLDGVDDDWVSADATHPTAFYNRLPRGTHHLLVRIRQSDGTWSESADILTIVRRPHWYETWWTFCLYALIAAAILYLIFLYVRARQKQRVHSEVTQAKMNVLSVSHPFADQLISIVHEHLDDSDFDIEQLAAAVNTSKSTLHRRLKAEIDMTPLELMNSIRLKRAAELLTTDNACTVAEIAYAVGFASPKYFTQCFKTEFGVTPTEYRKRHGQS